MARLYFASERSLKNRAKSFHRSLKDHGSPTTLTRAQDAFAILHGYRDWSEMLAAGVSQDKRSDTAPNPDRSVLGRAAESGQVTSASIEAVLAGIYGSTQVIDLRPFSLESPGLSDSDAGRVALANVRGKIEAFVAEHFIRALAAGRPGFFLPIRVKKPEMRNNFLPCPGNSRISVFGAIESAFKTPSLDYDDNARKNREALLVRGVEPPEDDFRIMRIPEWAFSLLADQIDPNVSDPLGDVCLRMVASVLREQGKLAFDFRDRPQEFGLEATQTGLVLSPVGNRIMSALPIGNPHYTGILLDLVAEVSRPGFTTPIKWERPDQRDMSLDRWGQFPFASYEASSMHSWVLGAIIHGNVTASRSLFLRLRDLCERTPSSGLGTPIFIDLVDDPDLSEVQVKDMLGRACRPIVRVGDIPRQEAMKRLARLWPVDDFMRYSVFIECGHWTSASAPMAMTGTRNYLMDAHCGWLGRLPVEAAATNLSQASAITGTSAGTTSLSSLAAKIGQGDSVFFSPYVWESSDTPCPGRLLWSNEEQIADITGLARHAIAVASSMSGEDRSVLVAPARHLLESRFREFVTKKPDTQVLTWALADSVRKSLRFHLAGLGDRGMSFVRIAVGRFPVLCPSCSRTLEESYVFGSLRDQLEARFSCEEIERFRFTDPDGCEDCGHSGISGYRLGLITRSPEKGKSDGEQFSAEIIAAAQEGLADPTIVFTSNLRHGNVKFS